MLKQPAVGARETSTPNEHSGFRYRISEVWIIVKLTGSRSGVGSAIGLERVSSHEGNQSRNHEPNRRPKDPSAAEGKRSVRGLSRSDAEISGLFGRSFSGDARTHEPDWSRVPVDCRYSSVRKMTICVCIFRSEAHVFPHTTD